uniref:Dehydrogenase/reductase SDR family member 11 n=1 Tax=Lygus hesperus TaxID=30085 RepID=A0A0A9W1B8_LYGHE
MQRWAGKLAVVTGASSGIGAAIVRDLAKNGVNVVGIARRDNNVKVLSEEMKGAKGKIYPLKADLEKEEDIVESFKWIESNLKTPVHILVNNAGLSILGDTVDGKMKDWQKMFNVNVLAVGTCIREHLKSMKQHNVNDGHIIDICSIVGHRIIDFPGFYVYTATKHAVKVITEGVRQELLKAGSHTRITTVSPGYVSTELFAQAGAYSQQSASALDVLPHLQAPDVSNAVIHALSLPQHVRVHDLTIQATSEKF